MSDFWKRVDSEESSFRGREARSLGASEELAAQNVLAQSGYLEFFECEECGSGHVERVVWLRSPGVRPRAFITCADEVRVELDREDLTVWSVDLQALASVVSAALGAGSVPIEEISERVWLLGSVWLGGRTRDVFMVRGAGWEDGAELLHRCNRLATSNVPLILVPYQLPNDPAWAEKHRCLVRMSDHYWFTGATGETRREFDEILFQHDIAASTLEQFVFRRTGATWQLTFEGSTTHVPHQKGLNHIAELLRCPGTRVEAAQLVSGDAQQVLKVQTAGLAATDSTSLREVRKVLLQKQREREDLTPEEFADVPELDREIKKLEKYLASASDQQGRARKERGTAQAARTAATNAIRGAIKSISESHKLLGEHLQLYIKTGVKLVYHPPDAPDWSL